EVAVDDQGGHAGAPVRSRHLHAVDGGLVHARRGLQPFSHLGGGDVLALPAEGVADAVDEIEISLAVQAHQVAGGEPGVARLEDVVDDLLLRLLAVEVAGVFGPRIAADLADALTDLAGRAFHAETVRRAYALLGLVV